MLACARAQRPSRRAAAVSSAALLAAFAVVGSSGWLPDSRPSASTAPSFTVRQIAEASPGESDPHGIARLGARLFIAFDNGVAVDCAPSPTGATNSVVHAYTLEGQVVGSWTIPGKVAALAADEASDRIVAVVNPGGNSSLFTVSPDRPAGAQLRQYRYRGLTPGDGTGGVAAFAGHLYVSASERAPAAGGKTFTSPALYQARINDDASATAPGTVDLTPVLAGDASAVDLRSGRAVRLSLSTPGSTRAVPTGVPGDGGSLVLDSVADRQLVLVHGPGDKAAPGVLGLTAPVADTAFATSAAGTLYAVDSVTGRIVAVTGPFTSGEALGAVPGDSASLPGALARIDLKTGGVTALAQLSSPSGLLFVDAPTTTPGGPGPTGAPSATPAPPVPTPPAATTPPGGGTGGTGGPGTTGPVPRRPTAPGGPWGVLPGSGMPPTAPAGRGLFGAGIPAPVLSGGRHPGVGGGAAGMPQGPGTGPFSGPVGGAMPPTGMGQTPLGGAVPFAAASSTSSSGPALGAIGAAGAVVGAGAAHLLRRGGRKHRRTATAPDRGAGPST